MSAASEVYDSGEFLIVKLDAVKALGSWEAAAIWHRIVWRSRRNGGCWVATIETIAGEVMLSEYRTKVALRAIRDAGWVRTERAGGYDATLRWEPLWDGELRSVSDSFDTEDFDFSSLQDMSRTTPPPNSPTDDAGLFVAPTALAVVEPDGIAEGFAAWWSLYPRKVSRAKALAAYRKARRSGTAEQLEAGLRAQLAGLEARPMDKRPHATTWLNGERWMDDAEHAAPIVLPAAGGRARNYFAETALAGRGAELLASLNGEHRAIDA